MTLGSALCGGGGEVVSLSVLFPFLCSCCSCFVLCNFAHWRFS
jgi:hypothetical protein